MDKKTSDFTLEERNLMAVAFKNIISSERKSIKLVTDIATFDKFTRYEINLNQYRKKIEKILTSKCQSICDLCELKCLPLAATSESKVFFLKLIADYYRYSSEEDCNDHDS